MIGKISTPRGEHVQPLLYYLFGPGRREEHTDPHLVAGWRHPADLEPPLRADGKRDFTTLAGLLLQPQAALGKRAYARPVWHCSMRAAPEDRMLSDDEWAAIAHDVMDRAGLSPYGQEDEAVRWVAVRHGEDHIHIVAMLARQDGGKPSLSWERYKVRATCLAAEQRYGLRSTAPADRTAARRPTRAEDEKAARRGLDEAPRITLRRHVTTAAASANDEEEFFARLDQAGILVRKRFSVKNPGQVTGYSVAFPGDTARNGGPVWYGGGKLAPDLSWPKLRQRWAPNRATPGRVRLDLTAEERNAVWEHVTRIAADATAQIRTWPGRTRLPPPMRPGRPPIPCTWPPPCWAAASCGRLPTPTTAPPAHRMAASRRRPRWGTSYGRPPGCCPRSPTSPSDRSMAPLVLIAKLAALAEAVAELRQSQQHAAQAAAALRAAERLHAAARPAPAAQPRAASPQPQPAPQPSSAAQLAALSFPKPARAGRQPPAPGQPGPAPSGPMPPRRPPPPRPRGPSR